ncbi:MAG: VWA domain-containing protein [Lachnospiraceae bacterium]|nr:VWA domain-containing protein [Lachnospiraceae bacterium]
MSDLDLFAIYDNLGEKKGKPELELSFDFDYENLLNDGKDKNVKLCVSVKPSDDLRRSFEKSGGNQSTHICLLIDTSNSMKIILDNTNAVRTGETSVGEDGRVYNIVTGGISKLRIAVESAKKVVNLLRPDDTLSCITYDDRARVVFEDLTVSDKTKILNHLDSLIGKYGMNTNISEALLLADRTLSKYTDAVPKRVIFFTDGEPTGTDTEEKGIHAGQTLAEHGISIESMGFGKDDVNFPYLQKISSSSGGITTLINYPDEFASIFSSMFEQSQSVVVSNVRLLLRLTAGTKIYDYYRGTPDNVYLGNRNGSEERMFEINLGQIEKNQMYKYYFNVMLPGVEDDYEGQINTMNAELRFYVPGKYQDQEQTIRMNVPVNYTSDQEETMAINGNVNILFRLAEVKRFDEEREKAFQAGDREATVRWIKKIIDVYTELQKPVEAEAYTEMLNQYMKTNSISKAILNKATSSSSQAQETGILEDLSEEEMSRFASRLKNRRKRS